MGDNRPTWFNIQLTYAKLLSGRSTCKRASVGCVITSWDHNRVLSIGYNGNYRGGPNTCDSDEQGNCGCIHSEANALIKLDFNDPVRKRLYCTTSPCHACAKLIVNANIDQVIYSSLYRKREGLDLLTKNSIDIIYHKPI